MYINIMVNNIYFRLRIGLVKKYIIPGKGNIQNTGRWNYSALGSRLVPIY